MRSPARSSLELKRRALRRSQPLSVHLELTYRCNWRCVFCYNPRHSDVRGLTGREWIAVLDELRALGTLNLTLTGGEPLAHPDLLEIGRAARERAMALRIFTNGSLVSEAMADQIAVLRPVAVEMSLHGARAETHDLTTGQPGSLEAMLRGLDRLRARRVRVLLKTPLTRLNEGELEGMIALAAARGVPYRVDATLTPRDDGDLSPLAYAASAAGTEQMYRRVAALGSLPVAEHEAGGVNCGLGRLTMAIDPEGNVYPCLQWRKSSLGNVRSTPLRELWRAAPVREEAATVSLAASARLLSLGPALSSFPFCPAIALQRTGDPLVPDKDHVARAEIVARVRREIA